MLTQDQKQKFIACLEQKMKVKLVFQWEDFLYFQYIGCSETGGAAAYIAGAKDTARIPMEKLQVLVEYPTVPDKRKFAFCAMESYFRASGFWQSCRKPMYG